MKHFHLPSDAFPFCLAETGSQTLSVSNRDETEDDDITYLDQAASQPISSQEGSAGNHLVLMPAAATFTHYHLIGLVNFHLQATAMFSLVFSCVFVFMLNVTSAEVTHVV